jgi:F-type H+-transporting ATPase subunit epsilon
VSFATTIVDPEKVAWKGNALQVVLGISDGLVGILPGHADAILALQPEIARITSEDGTEKKVFISGGVARIVDGTLTVVADTAEFQEQIDKARAEKSLNRAKERLAKSDRTINYERARLSLNRALRRLEISQ